MVKVAKSYRFDETDLKLLDEVHNYYKNKYESQVSGSNMGRLLNWSYAQTLAVLIRDRHEELVKSGGIYSEAKKESTGD